MGGLSINEYKRGPALGRVGKRGRSGGEDGRLKGTVGSAPERKIQTVWF